MPKLTDKQELFCREYLIDLNATQAAIRAGYSKKTAPKIGSENLQKPDVQAVITKLKAERNKSTTIDAEYVLNRLKEIDQLDVLDILEDDLSAFKRLSEWPKSWRTSVSSIDMKRMITGDVEAAIEKIKWPDKVKNLELIGRHVSVRAWEKELTVETVANNIMPVPVADSIDSWEDAAKSQQEAILNGG